MKRLIAFGIGLVWGGAALAASPVQHTHPVPAATMRPVSAAPVSQPLPAAVAAAPALPHAPGVPCPTSGCTTAGCETDGRTCLERFTDWLCYRPGPRVLPLCTPNPYRAPVRHYFPCNPRDCLVVGGCKPTAGGSSCTTCGGPVAGMPHPTPAMPAYHNPAPVPVPATIPAAPQPSAMAYPPASVARPTLADRVRGVFSTARANLWPEINTEPLPYEAYTTQPVAMPPAAVPAPGGHRFATPSVYPRPANPQTGTVPASHQQPVSRPFTQQ